MGELLAALLIVVAVFTALVALGTFVAASRLKKANRVDPAIRSNAPVSWLFMPTRPARLHRRLRESVKVLQPGKAHPWVAPAPETDSLRSDLAEAAVSADEWLLWASAAPPSVKKSHLRAAENHVVAIEGLSLSVTGLRPPLTADTPGELAEMAERVKALDEGRREVASLGQTPGTATGAAQLPPPRRQKTQGASVVSTPAGAGSQYWLTGSGTAEHGPS